LFAFSALANVFHGLDGDVPEFESLPVGER